MKINQYFMLMIMCFCFVSNEKALGAMLNTRKVKHTSTTSANGTITFTPFGSDTSSAYPSGSLFVVFHSAKCAQSPSSITESVSSNSPRLIWNKAIRIPPFPASPISPPPTGNQAINIPYVPQGTSHQCVFLLNASSTPQISYMVAQVEPNKNYSVELYAAKN